MTDVFKNVRNNSAVDLVILPFSLFLSGFCGIAYEVLYFRILSNSIGDHFAVSAALLITFLLGIALGTRLAYRFSRYLWAVEGSIGLYALGMVSLAPSLERFIYAYLPAQNMALSILVCCAVLAAPAFLVGISLPLFAGYLKSYVRGRTFSYAYTIYNTGAALTAIAIEFYLIRKLGLKDAVLTISFCNLAIAGVIFARYRRIAPEIKKIPSLDYPFRPVVALILAGIGSAVFQLLALKLASFIFGPYRETFAMVLGITLLGIALGASINHFFKTGLLAFLIANILFFLALLFFFFPVIRLYAANFQSFQPPGTLLWKLCVLFLIMGWASSCFGASIPALMTKESNVAKESGYLLYVASLSNVAGYLLMVFIVHPLFEYGQIILVITFILTAATIVYAWPSRRVIAFCFFVFLAALIVWKTAWNENILYLDYTAFTSPRRLAEELAGYEGSRRLRQFDETFAINTIEGRDYFFINGYVSMRLGNSAEYIVGVLSAFVAPRTESTLVLGMGSGATAGTLAQVFDKVDTVEISPVVIKGQPLMKEYSFDIMSLDNTEVICDDGIRYIKSAPRKYDLIVNTVTSPLYFSSSKLYTQDFFKAVKEKLTKGGIYTTWLDGRIGEEGVQIILRTLKEEFGYSWLALIRGGYYLLLCSNQPLSLKQQDAIFSNETLSEYFIKEFARPLSSCRYAYLLTDSYACLGAAIPLNTNDNPVLEYAMAQLDIYSLGVLPDCIKYNYSIEDVGAILAPAALDPLSFAMYFLQSDPPKGIIAFVLDKIEARFPGYKDRFPSYILKFYRDTAAKYPSPENKETLADWLEYYVRHDESEQVLRGILAKSPGHYMIHYRIGRALYEQGKFTQSREMFIQEIKINPSSTYTLFWLGRASRSLSLHSEAISWFKKCLQLNPWYDDANYYAALSAMDAGRPRQARAFFMQELRIDPGDTKLAAPQEILNSEADARKR
jgi:predicted membrane-bound spermidine synthase/tetratricopeptide (TPR) repeat protein